MKYSTRKIDAMNDLKQKIELGKNGKRIVKHLKDKQKTLDLKMQTELTPDIADKIWKSFEKKLYDKKVSKEAVLHHLKQLKAQMGKLRASMMRDRYISSNDGVYAIDCCMEIIDNKINKINSK